MFVARVEMKRGFLSVTEKGEVARRESFADNI